jgi:hypothetical protein
MTAILSLLCAVVLLVDVTWPAGGGEGLGSWKIAFGFSILSS